MSKKRKKIILTLLLIVSLLILILQLFVFEKPDGTIGLVLCTTCILTIIFSIIKLCQLSKTFKAILQNIIDALFLS